MVAKVQGFNDWIAGVQNQCPLGHRNDPQDEERRHIPLTHADVIDEDERTVRRVRDERDKAVARGAGRWYHCGPAGNVVWFLEAQTNC